jgi:hypothetical protein
MFEILPEQPELCPVLPTVEGNVDYSTFRQQLLRMDELLRVGGVETDFVARALRHWGAQAEPPLSRPSRISVKQREKFQRASRQALRCGVARALTQESYRAFSCHLADSALLQRFCAVQRLGTVRVPSKSTVQRYEQWLPAEEMRAVIEGLLKRACAPADARGAVPLGLQEPLEVTAYFLDTTCLPAPIHFPVDWVLLRDAARTLMKATALIRRHGLRQRMRPPEEFLRAMNRRAIAMTQARRKSDSKKQRKSILRQMKQLLGVIRRHAQRHRRLLDERWEETDWSRAQAQCVLRRMDNVLELLPQAIHQAHERLIGERLVPNDQKLLSLYERDAQVLVRGKASAEVEFGNKLLLGELPCGLIADWQLFREKAPADSQLVRGSVERVRGVLGSERLREVAGDRGTASAANHDYLREQGLYDALCPRDPKRLSERMKEHPFARLQTRRAQTEGRVGLFKNNFVGRPLRAKGHLHREIAVAWAVLAHNLWVLARLEMARAESPPLAQAA